MSKTLWFGIAFAAVNAFMLAGMSLFSKLLFTYYGPIEITFFRNFISMAVLIIGLMICGKMALLKTKRPVIHFIRSAIGTSGIVVGTWAITLMPLAEVTVLLFTSPLFVVLLSYPILKEPVGIYRLGAVCIGFIGVIIVINPAQAVNALPFIGGIMGLIWGFSSACVDICLRYMGKTENSMATTFYFVLFGSLACGFHWPWADIKPNAFSIDAILIILGLGITGVLALLAKTQSYRMGEASIIAPIMYTMIIWTMLFDYLYWEKIPTLNMITGTIIIICSNLFILYRERHTTQTQKMTAPT